MATNITPEAATEITSLPFTDTVDISAVPTGSGYVSTCDSTQYRALWYKWTAGPRDIYLAFGRSSSPALSVAGKVSIWHGSLGSLTQYTVSPQNFCASLPDNYFSVPVVPGTTYYFQVTATSNSAPAGQVVISAIEQPFISAPLGSVVITDDHIGFPAAVIDKSTGAFLQFVDLFVDELADTMPTGEICGASNTAGYVSVFDAGRNLIASVNVAPGRTIGQIKSDRSDLFYIVSISTSPFAKVHTVSRAGVLGSTTWNLPSNSQNLSESAVTRDGSIIYYAPSTASAVLHAYDLTNDVALPDLHTNFTTERCSIDGDGFVANDGSILIGYCTLLGGTDGKIRRFDAAGTVLNTYAVADADHRLDHFCFGSDDPPTLVSWCFSTIDNTSLIETRLLSDGSVVDSVTVPMTSASGKPADAGVTFAISDSCPLFVTPAVWAIVSPERGSGIYRMIPDRTKDTIYISTDDETTVDVKIPDPFAETALFGDE